MPSHCITLFFTQKGGLDNGLKT